MSVDQPLAIVLGLSPTGLYAVRELGRAGIPVAGVASQSQSGLSSKYLRDRVVLDDPGDLADVLCTTYQDTREKPVLIPTSDEFIELIIRSSRELAPQFRFQSSYGNGLAGKLLDKESFYRICDTHGVAYPKLISVSAEELADCAARVQFPCMIKPSLIHEIKHEMAGEKGWIARDQDELDRVASRLPKRTGTLLVQEIVPGPESEITLQCAHYREDGGIEQSFTARKLRQYPPGFGSASLVQSNDESDSREIAERLLVTIGYKGIAASEFKRDPRDGQLKIIEINTRPSLWFSASTASGRTVTLAAYNELALGGAPLTDSPQTQGVRWRYWTKDMWSKVFYMTNRSFLLPPPQIETCGPAKHLTNAVYASDDPKPAFAEIAHLARKAMGRLTRSFRGR